MLLLLLLFSKQAKGLRKWQARSYGCAVASVIVVVLVIVVVENQKMAWLGAVGRKLGGQFGGDLCRMP